MNSNSSKAAGAGKGGDVGVGLDKDADVGRGNVESSSLASSLASYTRETPGLPSEGHLVMRTMPMPSDANANGDIFGGWIMAQVDLAGSVLPYRIAKGRITTVAVNQFVFKQAVSVGDLLSFYAHIERIGTTSITVRVEVYAERNPIEPIAVKVTEAHLTFVAIDAQGKPRPIPKP